MFLNSLAAMTLCAVFNERVIDPFIFLRSIMPWEKRTEPCLIGYAFLRFQELKEDFLFFNRNVLLHNVPTERKYIWTESYLTYRFAELEKYCDHRALSICGCLTFLMGIYQMKDIRHFNRLF